MRSRAKTNPWLDGSGVRINRWRFPPKHTPSTTHHTSPPLLWSTHHHPQPTHTRKRSKSWQLNVQWQTIQSEFDYTSTWFWIKTQPEIQKTLVRVWESSTDSWDAFEQFLYLGGFQLYFEDLICMYIRVYSHCINHLQGPILADTADSNWVSFNKGAGFMETSKAWSCG